MGFIDTVQRRGRELADPKFVPYGVAFDIDKLTWEMDFFLKHYLEAYRGIAFQAAEREAAQVRRGQIVAPPGRDGAVVH